MAGDSEGSPPPYRVRYARRANGRYPAKDFLDSLETRDRDSFDKFMRLFEKFQAGGPEALGRNAYKALEAQGGIVQFTIWKYRVFGYRVANEVFLTNGFKKDQDETPANEIRRAHDIRAEHQQPSAGKGTRK